MNEHAWDELRRVAQLADELGPALVPASHKDLLRSITSAAMRIFDAAACSVALIEGEELVFHVASGAGASFVEGMRMPASRGIAGWVVTSGQPIGVEDVADDPRFASDVAESTGYTPRSILAMPLETERGTIGVISVLDRRSSGGAGNQDMELLDLFARQAALAIENSRIFTELGRALFQTLGAASPDRELGESLMRTADESIGPSAEMAELAAVFHELSLAGSEERHTAVRLMREFLTFVQMKARRR